MKLKMVKGVLDVFQGNTIILPGNPDDVKTDLQSPLFAGHVVISSHDKSVNFAPVDRFDLPFKGSSRSCFHLDNGKGISLSCDKVNFGPLIAIILFENTIPHVFQVHHSLVFPVSTELHRTIPGFIFLI